MDIRWNLSASPGLNAIWVWERSKSAAALVSGMSDAYNLVNRIEPDLVIGTGGYVCGPVLLWGAMKRVPTAIQEQNAMPGVTNKILSHFVDKVFFGLQGCGKIFFHSC